MGPANASAFAIKTKRWYVLVRGEDRIVVRAIPPRTHYANVGTD
jgi:hypothetical protein